MGFNRHSIILSIIGIAPEFVYTDGLEVEEVTVKFELDDSIVDNTLGTYTTASGEFDGINRLNVFMFFEDVNMLLPVETFHDEATNTVYTTTDRMGTYCLVDMELFFDNLDIAPSDDDIEEGYDIETQEILDEPVFSSYNISELKINTGYTESTVSTEYKDNFDVAFVIDEVNYTDEEIAAICEKIRITSITIWKYSPHATICVYGLNGNGVTHCNWYGRASLADDTIDGGHASIGNCLDKVSSKHSVVTSPIVSKAIDYVAEAYIEGRSEYCFVFYNSGNSDYHISGKEDSKKTLYNINAENKEINISVVSNYEGNKNSYDELMVSETDGKRIAEHVSSKEFLKDAFKHIYGRALPDDSTYEYSMGVFANNWKQVELNAPITYLHYDLSRRDDLTIDDIDYYECVDTDLDGLYDFQEIMFSYNGKDTIIFESTEPDGEILKLYTLLEIAGTDSIYDLPVYVENVFQDMEYLSDEYIEFITTPLIFIYSDPTSGDGDRDTISDPYDIYPLVNFNYTTTRFSEFIDTAEFFEILFIFECPMMKGYTSDECVDCIEILRKYKGTNDIVAFQNEMISSGLVSPDAASSVNWFDKIMWSEWSENRSAPLLSEYENYSKDTSFEKLFEERSNQWHQTARVALTFWAFGITTEYVQWMNSWHKISYVPEDYSYQINYDMIKTQKHIDSPNLSSNPKWERDVLNSFSGGKASTVTYTEGTTLYRVGGKNGGFWSLNSPPKTEYQWRVDYAIKQEFKNDASLLYKITIPKGSSISGLEGTVGSQGMGLYGGAHQVYIDYLAVPKDWIEITPMIWG